MAVACGSCLLGTPIAQAENWQAKSTISWGVGKDERVVKTGTTKGGSFTLGKNTITFVGISPPSYSAPQEKHPYAAGKTTALTLGPKTYAPSPLGNKTTASADSTMKVMAAEKNGMLPWELTLDARCNTDWFSPTGYATARGADPQYVETPGVFASAVYLAPGSSVFRTAPEIGSAAASLALTGPDPLTPGANVELAKIVLELVEDPINPAASLLDATVELSILPGLSFYDFGDPNAPLAPIDAKSIESRIESSALVSEAGLAATLNLFTYRYDLTAAVLSGEAAFGAEAEGFATAIGVPEPGTAALMLIIAAGLRLRSRNTVR